LLGLPVERVRTICDRATAALLRPPPSPARPVTADARAATP
ncbi:RNA polymerase subunit sigma-70, partial [Streptomyces sp. SID5926]|nr:RNA polymerase subunit sigma-70 [Streptomyces sp. SID5926]